ncbi:Cyclic-di-GMP-binding biofilm dispersal mediator protein [compost metagenome]
MLRWNNLTPRRASSLATLLPTAAGVRLKRRAASAKLPTSALRTKHSILLKVSISATINFWFTQTIATMVYTARNPESILASINRDISPRDLEIDMTTQNLSGKVALIQGGSRGIGAAIVKRLAAEGATVAFTYVSSTAKAEELQDSITAKGGKALAIKADSADADAIRGAVSATVEAFGRLDILVNNAGVLAVAPLAEFKLEDFDQTLAINVRSVFIATQAAARHMTEGGRIINIGSTNADRMPFAGGGPYAMSKSALVGLTKGLARDLGPQGITINNVQPGPVDTDMNPAEGDFAESLIPLMAVGRYGKAEEIASFVAYLVSPEAGYITGASLTIDGGFGA